MGPKDQGLVVNAAPKETISLGSLPSREEKTLGEQDSEKASQRKSEGGTVPPQVPGGQPPRGTHPERESESAGKAGSSTEPRDKQKVDERPRPPKPPRPRKDRQEPDLSGLRDILEEVMDEEGIEHDLDKRIEEESVNDILGK